MRLELKNAQTVIRIAHNKLIGHLETINKHIAVNKSEELAHALNGK